LNLGPHAYQADLPPNRPANNAIRSIDVMA